ncbi:MAG: hypothetical protein ABI837_15720, partial [Acidobacteriota bacterium]
KMRGMRQYAERSVQTAPRRTTLVRILRSHAALRRLWMTTPGTRVIRSPQAKDLKLRQTRQS